MVVEHEMLVFVCMELDNHFIRGDGGGDVENTSKLKLKNSYGGFRKNRGTPAITIGIFR